MKKIKEILIGTNNEGKIKEISYLLNKKIKKLSPIKLNITSPNETGKSFKSNSELKAKYFFQKTKIFTISDDSGLCIECLNNKPGIHSARWAKKYGSLNQAMNKIIKLVKDKNKNKKIKNSKAKFVCSLTVYFSPKRKITTIGEIHGKISGQILGKNGFGYDPIFIPDGYNKTFGEMNLALKMSIDHRYKAFSKIKKFFFNTL